jgi:hypothetical protein
LKELFSINQKVKIKKLSKESYLLYKQYKQSSPLIVCPCHLEDKILEIKNLFNDQIALLQYEDSITIVYLKDLIIAENLRLQTP